MERKKYRYLGVYEYYKELIMSGKMAAKTRLPSIRRCAAEFEMSRTTIETAYLCLAADGYIISKAGSGYYVTDCAKVSRSRGKNTAAEDCAERYKYDYASGGVDKNSFDFSLWQRYIKSALRTGERLLSYGEPQGEYELREAICRHLWSTRNAVCSPDSVVVGAGFQSLLHILIPLFEGARSSVYFANKDFKQGAAIFEDYGFSAAESCNADIIYVAPSQMTRRGEVMPAADRLSLIRRAAESGALIIEDDYDSEFCYFNRPIPCLQGLAGGENVVYISTFSKLLVPSIRISFMILPPELAEAYARRKQLYNQTASKIEQLALAKFIADGHLASQIRKTRRIYSEKAKIMVEAVKSVFGEDASATVDESGFSVRITIKTTLSSAEIAERAARRSVAVIPVGEGGGYSRILLLGSGVAAEDYAGSVEIIKECMAQ